MTALDWAEVACPTLKEQLRSIFAVHVDDAETRKRLLRMVLLAIRQEYHQAETTCID